MSEQKDISQKPAWLSQEYLGKIFSDFVNQGKSQKEQIDWNVEISQFTKILDNLNTAVFKVKVENRKNPEQVFNAFVKILSKTGANNFGISVEVQKKMFEREGKIYEDFLSEARKLSSKIDDFDLVFPTFYYFGKDPLILVIEDMSPKGFKTDTKIYSLAQCEAVFENLARYHALSYYMHHELKRDLSVYNNFLAEEITKNISIIPAVYQLFMQVVSKWNGCSEFVAEMKKFEPFYVKKLIMTSADGSSIRVLTHGDSHKHNYLFRNDLMKDCAIVDFQTVSWISLAYDIIATFNTFCEPEDNLNSRDILLKCYHREFQRVLKKLGFSHRIPTLFDIHKEVLQHGIIDLLFWTVYCPLASVEKSQDTNKSFIERFQDALNDSRQKELAKFFPTFLNRGYFDYEED